MIKLVTCRGLLCFYSGKNRWKICRISQDISSSYSLFSSKEMSNVTVTSVAHYFSLVVNVDESENNVDRTREVSLLISVLFTDVK